MGDPNYMHKYWPTRKQRCGQIVSGVHCHLPEDALVHKRYAQKQAELKREKQLRFTLAPFSSVVGCGIMDEHNYIVVVVPPRKPPHNVLGNELRLIKQETERIAAICLKALQESE
jgi:hypothetical protein